LLKNNVFLSLIALDNWRKSYNGENVGFGYDQYKPTERFHYPEAYALWGNGYLKLYEVVQKKEYLELSKKCAHWLKKNRNINYENFSWGLPWVWEQRKAPKTLSYLITTVLVGDFLMAFSNYTQNTEFENIVEGIAQWILEENGGVIGEKETWFYYANHSTLRFPVINPNSKASGFFSKLYLKTRKTNYETLAKNSARYVMNRRNPDGSWYYGTENKYIDNVHTGFIIEGLCDVYSDLPYMRNKLWKILMDSYNFYWNRLYTPDGFGKECIQKRTSRIFSLIRKRKASETRLWGYASGIRAFTHLSEILKIQNKGNIIAKYVIKNLQTESGGFKYKSNNDSFFIRNEAHMFDSLATLLKMMEKT